MFVTKYPVLQTLIQSLRGIFTRGLCYQNVTFTEARVQNTFHYHSSFFLAQLIIMNNDVYIHRAAFVWIHLLIRADFQSFREIESLDMHLYAVAHGYFT